MLNKKFFCAVTLLTLVAGSANAAVILNNASQGLYNSSIGNVLSVPGTGTGVPFPCSGCNDDTINFPTAPDLSAAATPLGQWLTTPGTPGGSWGGLQAIPTSWTVDDETAIIYAIDAGIGLTNLNLRLGVDNGIFVWVDGVYRFGARAGGGSSLDEYAVTLSDFGAGIHYIQILREDHGGGTGYDIELTGVAKVAEPSALALVGLALAAMGWAGRRRPQV